MGNKTHQEILAKQIGRNRFNRLFADRHQPDQPSILRLAKYSKLALLQRLRDGADKVMDEVLTDER